MISDSEFELYVKKLQLPASAVELLRAVRVNPAVRRVESHVGNSNVRYGKAITKNATLRNWPLIFTSA